MIPTQTIHIFHDPDVNNPKEMFDLTIHTAGLHTLLQIRYNSDPFSIILAKCDFIQFDENFKIVSCMRVDQVTDPLRIHFVRNSEIQGVVVPTSYVARAREGDSFSQLYLIENQGKRVRYLTEMTKDHRLSYSRDGEDQPSLSVLSSRGIKRLEIC